MGIDTPNSDLSTAKVSLSLPSNLAAFLDRQCSAFGIGRSAYLQLLLDAEQESPRREFVKKAREIPG